jgi:hypothetical protein
MNTVCVERRLRIALQALPAAVTEVILRQIANAPAP